MKLLSLVFIFLCCVYYVRSETSFIPQGQRAEIFELTDNEVPVFRITLPNDEYNSLKLKASAKDSNNFTKINDFIKEVIEMINVQNFNEIFPGYDFKEILPELPMNEYGYPNIDYEKFYIDINNLHYIDLAFIKRSFYNIFKNNSYLDLINVFHTLYYLNISSDVDVKFTGLIQEFGTADENSFYNYNNSLYSDFNYDYPNSIISNNDSLFDFERYFLRSFNKVSADPNNNANNKGKANLPPIFDNPYEEFQSNDFNELFKDYNFDKSVNDDSTVNEEETGFKTKNATLIVEINNEKKTFDEVTFSLAGGFSRTFAKPGYNLKIRGENELYGRRQFKLRGDASEPTYMRTKLVSDIRNRLGMTSLSANYATLYINDEYLGLFILTDIYKESWIEYVYGEKDTQLLYKCNNGSLDYNSRSGFENENKEATNVQELYEFLAEMTKAKSASDVESFFELDQYYKEIAVDVLVSSWDHVFHNYYIYKNYNNNKWIYLSHDYDLDFGREKGPSMGFDVLYFSPTIEKLISKDDPRFRETIKEIVSTVFNPATLYPHIDEIKSFIRPYVELDKIPDENGQYPGRVNKFATDFYTLKQWDDSTEFLSIDSGEVNELFSLKRFILLKYQLICQEYELECDPYYLEISV